MHYHHINQKDTGVAINIFILDKADFRIKKCIRANEGHSIIIKESILQEDLTILNVYVPNNSMLTHVRQKLINFKEK